LYVSIAKLLKDPSRLYNSAVRVIYLVLKNASRDAEEVIKVSSYIFWDFISSDNVIVWENLLFPLLALVRDQAPRKDDGTDFGCAWIQSNGLIALEIKCYCRGPVNLCSTSETMQYRAYFWELVLTNLLLLPGNC
jgi:hypothetical protein